MRLNVIEVFFVVFAGVIFSGAQSFCVADDVVDLSSASIVAATDVVPAKTVEFLQEEIEKRSDVRLKVLASVPAKSGPIIIVGTVDTFPGGRPNFPDVLKTPAAADGFAAWVDASQPDAARIYLVGYDGRGAIFAAGHLLRKLEAGAGSVKLSATYSYAGDPEYAVRGHQVGYRHTANTYDAWTVPMYEQYIRDLIVFGANGVELIQEGGKGFRDGPVLQEDQWDRNVKLTQMMKGYGIDVWLWEPLRVDISDPKQAAAAMQRRNEFYSDCAKIDHVMVPGGDPGHTDPKLLMPWLRRQAKVLRTHFPNAGLWVSHQKFSPQQLDYFFNYLKDEQPDWLTGIVFGPGISISLEETRRRTPQRYPVRRYPDITHNVRCQYPVFGLDGVFAQTLGREGVNPRPVATRNVHNQFAKLSGGFVSYSDGAHDDLNKMIWSQLGWSETADLDEILADYGRVFFGSELSEDVAVGLKMLEKNLTGPVRDNSGIDETVRHWERIEDQGGASLANNWRFQMYLFRARFDAYIRARHLVELNYEKKALAALAKAKQTGVETAIADARAELAEADRSRPCFEQRVVLEEMGARLLRLIGYQLSVDEPYLARNPERGALLDKLDRPLNDRLWLETEFIRILKISDSVQQLKQLDRIVHWEDPGPGGFYDDLGNAAKEPHLVRSINAEKDPGFLQGPQQAHYRGMGNNSGREISPLKWSWLDYAQTGGPVPIVLQYDELSKGAKYRLRVTYHGRFGAVMQLTADGAHQIHDALPMPEPIRPVEFDIPQNLTRDGRLELRWDYVARGGCQIAEVWLIRE